MYFAFDDVEMRVHNMKNSILRKRFDRHRWEATLYEGKVEVLRVLRKLEDKTIKSIRLIGAAYGVCRIPYPETPFTEMGPVHSDQLGPCVFEFTEPVGINFTDGTTVELLPVDSERCYVGFNSIPAEIEDGTNNRNCDVNILCSKLSQMTIHHVSCYHRIIEQVDENYSSRTTDAVKYVFDGSQYMGESYGFSIEVSGERFQFAMTRSNHFYQYGNRIAGVSKELFDEAFKHYTCQIPIIDGHDSGSFFSINPIKIDKSKSNSAINEKREEEIAIEEDDVIDFLGILLNKYFNKELSVKVREVDDPYTDAGAEFEHYATHNVYSYDDIKKMLAEIRKIVFLLETDYDNLELEPYKKSFSAYKFSNDYEWNSTREEKEKIIHDNIHVAIDFYNRFVCRMEQMMEASPDYEMISFMGP